MIKICSLFFILCVLTGCVHYSVSTLQHGNSKPLGINNAKISIEQADENSAVTKTFGETFKMLIVNSGFDVDPSDSLVLCRKLRKGGVDDALVFQFKNFRSHPSVSFEVYVTSENAKVLYYRGVFENTINVNASKNTVAILSAQKVIDELYKLKII